ncbi:MAG: lamin tail domain-containing protein [Saprospiraceae bacterium]
MAPSAGSSALFRSFLYEDSLVWSFYIKLDFSPSATNKLAVVLMADQMPWDSSKAFYIEIGENGTNDNWKFFYKDASTKQLLGSGELMQLASDPAMARFNISLYQDSIWNFKVNYTGEYPLNLERTLFKQIPFKKDSCFFEFICTYTDSRKDRYYFDDVSIVKIAKDTLTPFVQSVETLDEHRLELQFTEPLNIQSSFIKINFEIVHVGFPDSIYSMNSNSCILHFKQNLTFDSNYVLKYKNISDLDSNINSGSMFEFKAIFSVHPEYHDLIITEIMADPSPPASLPEREYIEIKNTSPNILNLQNCILSDGSTEAYFGKCSIKPDSFLILCAARDTDLFKGYGSVYGLNGFPSINNAAEVVQLYNADFELIDLVQFDDSWYGSEIKKEGGYSLELMNEGDLCLGKLNWTASQHFSGGSPGRENSVASHATVDSTLHLTSLHALSEWEIKVSFNKNLDFKTIYHLEWFKITPNRSLATVSFIEQRTNELLILLNEPLDKGISYTLYFTEIQNCIQQKFNFNSKAFNVPAEPEMGDLTFSEVLFNPNSGGQDFIEIYNKSNQSLKCSALMISNPLTSNTWMNLNTDQVILPGGYLAFSSDPENLIIQYPFHDSLRIVKSDLPSISDEGGILILAVRDHNTLRVLDSFQFDESWHHPFLKDPEGVSLEKIHLELASDNKQNWQSASKTYFFATPGIKNSQWQDSLKNSEQFIPSLSSIWISPNGDNLMDFLEIKFHLPKSGFNSRIEVFDLSGYRVKKLKSQLLATDDFVIWNGDSDQGTRLARGNYIIRMELLHPDGDILQFKNRIIVDY